MTRLKTSSDFFWQDKLNLRSWGHQFRKPEGIGRRLGPIFLAAFIALESAGCVGVPKDQKADPVPALQIATTALPNGQVRSAYQASPAATGGTMPYNWSISSGRLPVGLSLSNSSGTISGIAMGTGEFPFILQVRDSSTHPQTTSEELSIVVSSNPVLVLTNSLSMGYVQQPYTSVLKAIGGSAPYTWSIVSGQLPPGVTFDNSTGQLAGDPRQGGEYSLSFQVNDFSGNSASKNFTLQVLQQQLDQYGGSMSMQCSSATGYFHLEKIKNRWWFCTPEGHEFWMEGVFDIGAHNSSITSLGTSYSQIALQKYGDLDMTWGPQQIRRIKSWGFNSIAEFSSGWTWPTWTCAVNRCPAEWINNGGRQPVPVPMTVQAQPSLYSLRNQNNYAPGAVKDTMYGVNLAYYRGWDSSFPDLFDPNFDAWLKGAMQDAVSSPWIIAWISDECDELYGLCGAGPDMATSPPGHNQRNQALMTLMTSPVQIANPGRDHVQDVTIYRNPVVFSKAQLQTYLAKKYSSVDALNAAWGSAYTTFGSTGTQVTGETIATGDGSRTSFTKTLAAADISPYSVAVKVNSVPVGADCPQWIALTPCSSVSAGEGSFIGPASATPAISLSRAGRISYSTGAVTVNFAAPPASGALITVDYVHNGWGYGTGLLDEDGRHSWIPTDSFDLGTNATFNGDMAAFLKALATEYFSITTTRIKQYAPNNLVFGPGVLGTWSAPADKNVLEAAAPYVDGIATTLDYTRAQAELSYTATHLGDKPMIIWLGAHGNADSAMWRYPDGSFKTQADRAAFYTSSVNSFLNTTNTAYNDYTVIGFRWWALQDSWGEKANWGLISLEDNPYDGQSAALSRGADPWGYATGGEEKNYGDFLDAVRAANLQWLGIH